MPSTTRASTRLDPSTAEREDGARRYVEQLRAFYAHACMFAIGMLIIFTTNLLTNLSAGIADEWSAWWSAWALLGWGLGITVHGLVVRLNRPSRSGPTWAQRQIDKELAR